MRWGASRSWRRRIRPAFSLAFAAVDRRRNALALRVDQSSAATPAPSPPPWSRASAISLRRCQGAHPRRRHFPHRHHLGRADDACRRHFLRRPAAPVGDTRRWRCTYPIKKWAAALAIFGRRPLRHRDRIACRHRARAGHDGDHACGRPLRPSVALHAQSRVCGFLVVAFEPEAILGASFQLSFAAVAALIAVYEARRASCAQPRRRPFARQAASTNGARRLQSLRHLLHGPRAAVVRNLLRDLGDGLLHGL